MAPNVSRELSIVYGSVTVGGTSDFYYLHDVHELVIDNDEARVVFDVLCRGSTESEFVTKATELEDEFRHFRQRLRILLGNETLHDWDPTANTGFNAEPVISKPGSRVDTARSRLYTVEIYLQLPANTAAQTSGRRDSSVRITTDASGRKVFQVTGQYTALNTNSATEQYESAVGTYETSIRDSLSGTFERINEEYEYDETDKVLRFTLLNQEIIANQASGVLDHAALKDQTLTVNKTEEAPGDSLEGTERPVTVTVEYAASVDQSQSTDLSGLWDDTIVPYLIEHGKTEADVTSVANVSQSGGFDAASNTIRGRVEMVAYDAGSLITSRVEILLETNEGIIRDPVWSGDPEAAFIYQGARIRIREIITDRIIVGQVEESSFQYSAQNGVKQLLDLAAREERPAKPDTSAGWFTLVTTHQRVPLTQGLDGEQESIYYDNQMERQVFAAQPPTPTRKAPERISGAQGRRGETLSREEAGLL